MASTTQIVPKFSFPYVETHINDYTQITNDTTEIVSDPSCTHVFVFRSSKGVDNVFVKKKTSTSFKTSYGDSDFSKYGQPLMMPLAVLESPYTTAWCMRVMPENATYAHKAINLHYLADVENRKFYIKLVGSSDATNAITTSQKLDEYADSVIPESGVDTTGFTVKRFETLRSAGRGVYGENYCIRASANNTYEKTYGLKMYTYSINSKEGNYKSVASYVGANTTTNKYKDNTFINDILEGTDIGVAPVIINVSEDSLKEVYDAYIAFCNKLNDEVLNDLVSNQLTVVTAAQKNYDDLKKTFEETYEVSAGDVVATSTLIVPKKLKELKTAVEIATSTDQKAEAQKAVDEYTNKYVQDVAKLQGSYATLVAAKTEYNKLSSELENSSEDNLPDFDEFDFIFGQKVNSNDMYPFIEIVSSNTATRTTTNIEEGAVTGDVDTSTLAHVVESTTDIDTYLTTLTADESTYQTFTVEPVSANAAAAAGADDYVVTTDDNAVYLLYILKETTAGDPDPIETKTLKYIKVGTKMVKADDTAVTVQAPLVGSDEELVNFGSTLGVVLSGGYDGYFESPRVEETVVVNGGVGTLTRKEWTLADEEEECFIKAFNGTYDKRILSSKRIPCDAFFDANYSLPVKKVLAELGIVRHTLTYLDTGIIPSYTTTTTTKLLNDYSVFDNYLISKNLQHYSVKEPSTGKRVKVTISYFLGQIYAPHYQVNGFEVPLVKTYARLSGHVPNSLEPSIEDFETDLKELFYENRFNYFETIGENVYQRATQITSQTVDSDLIEESNVNVLSVLKNGVEEIINDGLYNFTSATERQRLKDVVSAKYEPWIGQKVESLSVDFAVSEYEAEHSIIHCYIAVQFRALQKRAIVEIDLNKRNNSTASSVTTEDNE